MAGTPQGTEAGTPGKSEQHGQKEARLTLTLNSRRVELIVKSCSVVLDGGLEHTPGLIYLCKVKRVLSLAGPLVTPSNFKVTGQDRTQPA